MCHTFISWETPNGLDSKMSDLDFIFEILDNRKALDYYREVAEVSEVLDGELLPDVTFEPYGDN